MSTRRNLFKVGMASALIGQFGGFVAKAAAADGPLFKFGIIADPQYAPAAPNLSNNRYYANSLWKVSEAVATLNKEDLAFVVTLGDIIDRHWESFNHILPLYDDMKAEHFFLLGNHDYSVAPEFLNSVVRTAGMKSAHYDFTGGGYRFIVLDQNELAQFANAPGSANWRAAGELMARAVARNAPNAKPWNGAMSDQQYAWLDATLAKARASGEKAIVMGHYPIFPLALENNFLDDERLTEALVRACKKPTELV